MKFLYLVSLVAAVSAMHHNGFLPTHGYHVHHFRAQPTSPPPHGYANAMNMTMDLVVKAGTVTITLDLRLKTIQWGEGAQIITEFDSNGKPSKTLELFHRGYTGTAFVQHEGQDHVEEGTVSVTFFEDRRAMVLVSTSHDVYSVDLNEFLNGQFPLKGKDHGHGLHMSRFSDMNLGDAHEHEHRVDPLRSKLRKFLKTRPGGRRLNQLIPFENCFTGQATSQRAIRMGLISDPAYYGLKTNPSVSGTPTYTSAGDTTVVNAMIAELNRAVDQVYSLQLRVWMLAGTTIVGQAAAGLPMSSGSLAKGTSRSTACTQTDGSARLTALRQWRQSYQQSQQDTHALWHLFTDCHPPPGTVGIAYIGVICSKSYGVGWTNNVGTSGTWLTFAHEVGHNFNSPHSFDNGQGVTGGIMDYGSGYYPVDSSGRKLSNSVYQFNPLRTNDICGGITESQTSQSSWNIAPNQCWTVYQSVPTPTPTTKPTGRPTLPTLSPTLRPTRRPTLKPSGSPTTTRNPTGNPTTTTAKPTNVQTPSPTPPIPTVKPTSNPTTSTAQPTGNPTTTTARPTTARPTYRPSGDPTTSSPTRRPTTMQPTAVNTASPTAAQPIVTFAWVLDGNNYGPCSPSCTTGNQISQKLPIYVCEERTVNPPSTTATTRIVADSNCDRFLKPTGTPVACTNVQPCGGTCGDGQVSGLEKCDPGANACCLSDCTGYKQTYSCLKSNNVVDGAFMTCLNDVQSSDCYVYLFMGQYFNKFYAVPGQRGFFRQEWPAAIKHKGVVQNQWDTITAVAGGRNSQIYVFNKFEYLQIDYSDEMQGKVIKSGNLITDFNVPAEFQKCASGVTAAEVYHEQWFLLFCETVYTWANIVYPNYGARTVYPADRLFYNGLGNGMGVNAAYVNKQYGYIEVIRGNIAQAFASAGFVAAATNNVTTPSVYGTGSTPAVGNQTCLDPECAACTSPTMCDMCFSGYKVLGGRCIANKMLIDMRFAKNSALDQVYSSDPILTDPTTMFVADHGGVPNGAMRFTPTTQVSASAPGLNGRLIENFRIEVFYKPASVANTQTLMMADNRFEVKLTNKDATTMKLLVRFDHMTFDCYVPKPLTVNQWNMVAVEFTGRQIITFVNGFTHNRAYQNIAGGPTLGLSFQNVVIGAGTGGLDGDLDSFVIHEVPVTYSANAAAAPSPKTESPAWVLPVAITGAVLGFCLCAGLIFLCYSRGLCPSGEKTKGNDAQMMFMAASQQNQVQTNYVAMTDN